MKDPEKDPEEALRKLLSERFTDYELPVKPALRNEIFKMMPSQRFRFIVYLLPCLLGILATLFLFSQKFGSQSSTKPLRPAHLQPIREEVKTPSSFGGHRETEISKKDSSMEEQLLQTGPNPKNNLQDEIPNQTRRNEIVGYSANAAVKSDGYPDGKSEVPGSEMDRETAGMQGYKSIDTVSKFAGPKTNYIDANNKIISKQAEIVSQPVPESLILGSIALLKPLSFQRALALQLPTEIYFTPPLTEKKEVPIPYSKKTASVFTPKWLFSLTPMQNFQVMRLWSTPQLSLQHIRFAPVLSFQSKGLKVTGGLDILGFDVMANYSYIGNRVYFETATEEYLVEPSGSQSYTIVRRGIPLVKDENLHLLGIGIQKSLALGHGLLSNYRSTLGLDYMHSLSGKRNLVMANMGIYKQWGFEKNTTLSVGPYAQLGLTQQTVIPGVWKYRPYQLGVSIGLRRKK